MSVLLQPRVITAAAAVIAMCAATAIVVVGRSDANDARPAVQKPTTPAGVPAYAVDGIVLETSRRHFVLKTLEGEERRFRVERGVDIAHMQTHAAMLQPVRITYRIDEAGSRHAFEQEDLPSLPTQDVERLTGVKGGQKLTAAQFATIEPGMTVAEVVFAVGRPLYDGLEGRTREELCWQWPQASGPRDRFYEVCFTMRGDSLAVSRLDASAA